MSDPAAKTIVVVEDDDQTGIWIQRMLEKDGWVVTVVPDGKAAKALISGTPPPWLVTLDIALPDISGVELILHIKDSPGWQRVPIVMMTATPKDEGINWAVKQGAKAYLVKPLQQDELRATVQRLARKPG